MTVDQDISLGDAVFLAALGPILLPAVAIPAVWRWMAKRRATRRIARDKYLASLKRKQARAVKSAKPKAKQIKRPKALTAAQHRKQFGAPPAIRVINGGKA